MTHRDSRVQALSRVPHASRAPGSPGASDAWQSLAALILSDAAPPRAEQAACSVVRFGRFLALAS